MFFTNKPMILLVYKEVYFNTNNLDSAIPSVAVSLIMYSLKTSLVDYHH